MTSRTNLESATAEQMAQQELDDWIKSYERPITIDVVNMKLEICYTIKNIVACVSVAGNKKADFALVTDKNEKVFVSHKKHGKALDFLQYSGVSAKAGEKISSHEEVKMFLESIIQHTSKCSLKYPCVKKIKDKMLMRYALFGSDYVLGSNSFSENNCHMIAQGDPVLRPTRHEYRFELIWSGKWAVSGELTTFNGNYEPVLGAIYQNDRHFLINGEFYNARVGIYPADFFKNRQNLIVL